MFEAIQNEAPEWSSKVIGLVGRYPQIVLWVAVLLFLVLLFVTIKAKLAARKDAKDAVRYKGQAEAYDKVNDRQFVAIERLASKAMDTVVDLTKRNGK